MRAGQLNPITAGFAYTLAAVPTLLLVLSQVRRQVIGPWRMDMAACRLLLSYGVRSYGVDILGALALQVDQVLVISLLDPAAMGTYGVALSLSRMFNLFQGSAVSVLFPRASGCTADEILTDDGVCHPGEHSRDWRLRFGGRNGWSVHAQDTIRPRICGGVIHA